MYIWGDCFITRALLLTHACTAVFLINSAGIEHCFLDEFQCQSLKEQTSNRQNYTYCSHAQKLLSCMQKEDDPILTPRVSNGDRCCASGYANSKIGLHIWTLGQDPDLWCWSQLRTKNEHFTKALKESQKKGKTWINRFHSPVSSQGFLFGPLIAINFKTGLYVRYDTLLMAGPQNKHFTQAETHWAEWVFELYWLLSQLVLKLQLIVLFGWKSHKERWKTTERKTSLFFTTFDLCCFSVCGWRVCLCLFHSALLRLTSVSVSAQS